MCGLEYGLILDSYCGEEVHVDMFVRERDCVGGLWILSLYLMNEHVFHVRERERVCYVHVCASVIRELEIAGRGGLGSGKM